MRTRQKWLIPVMVAGVALVWATLPLLTASDSDAAEPTPKVAAHIDQQIIPAYRHGDQLGVAESVSSILVRLNEQQRTEADSYLVGKGIPSLGDLLGDARLELVETQDPRQEAKISPKEADVVMPRFKQRIEEIIGKYDRHPLARQEYPSSKDWDAYEEMFWDIHVMQNELAIAARISSFADQVSKPLARIVERNAKKNSGKVEDQNVSVKAAPSHDWLVDYSKLSEGISQRTDQLLQREMELRFYRLEDANATLADPSAGKPDRLHAAFAMKYDSSELKVYFAEMKKQPRKKRRDQEDGQQNILSPEVEQQVTTLVESATSNSGDTLQKSAMFFVGMHYWTRGRYGSGPEAWGLLKNRDAVQSEAKMFPLYMPAEPQPATDPMQVSSEKTPQIDRRHHYVWSVEYRPFSMAGESSQNVTNSETKTEYTQTKTTHMNKFY